MNQRLDGPDSGCHESHILELWITDSTNHFLVSLDDDKVISAINDPTARSRLTGLPVLVSQLLGVKAMSGDRIVSALATMMAFVTNGSENGTREWETMFLNTVLEFSKKELEPLGFRAIPFTERYSKRLVI